MLHCDSSNTLQLKPIRNAVEHFHISLDVVEFRYFRCCMAEEVGYLFGCEGFDVAVFVLCAVD